ncbi:MAG: hypothetical protein IIV02_04015 [Peptococcaceae bacterium]|nr:hypothetical protein [Peptococcaceae bacterium]
MSDKIKSRHLEDEFLQSLYGEHNPQPFGDLLWENASPTSNFAAQTISVDLNKYNFILVGYAAEASSPNNMQFRILLNDELKTSYIQYISRLNLSYRKVSIKAEGISFGSGSRSDYGGNTVVEDLGAVIPFRIYGIK